ncbi:MAG: hypothetical protein FIA98_13510 [Anaerolineae bacterium]|nr:hypothetical protein [Anaerolineae bacterium]
MEVTINQKTPLCLLILLVMTVSIACSLPGIIQKASSAKQTASALKTEVGGVISFGSSIIETAQALETQHPGVLATVKAIGTQSAPLLRALESAATDHPNLVQTAQAAIQQEVPSGEPPSDIPLLEHQQMANYFGSSQYIFYTSSSAYSYVLDFYQSGMANNGWQYIKDESHLYPNATQLVFEKGDRRATINLSLNTMNNTSTIIINISK